MFFLDAHGSLHIVFNNCSTLEELFTELEEAIDGYSVLQQAFLMNNPHLPATFFDGSTIFDMQSNFSSQSAQDLFVFAYLAFSYLTFLLSAVPDAQLGD
jgi:hypothetical protein